MKPSQLVYSLVNMCNYEFVDFNVCDVFFFFYLQGIILGSILFPLRVTLAALLFLIMWPLARLRLAGLSEEERSRPVAGWRRWLLHPVIWLLSRGVFFCLGFLWVRVKGRRADLKEAPVLVVVPHSGFMDMLVLCAAQLPTVVSRSENSSLPVIGGETQEFKIMDLFPPFLFIYLFCI